MSKETVYRSLESNFSNAVAIPYLINNDPIDIDYRKKKDQSRIETPISYQGTKFRLNTYKRDKTIQDTIFFKDESVEIKSNRPIRLRAVYSEDEKTTKSLWLVNREREISLLEQENKTVRVRGISDTFARIRSNFDYSNILSNEIDLFNVLSDVLDVALYATDQVELSYSQILKDIVISNMEEKDPSLYKLLTSEEYINYSLEEILEMIETTSYAFGDLIVAEIREKLTYSEESIIMEIEEFFKKQTKELATIMKIYSLDDEHFEVHNTEDLFKDFIYSLDETYKRIEELAIPHQFISKKEGLTHISVGDIAKLRSSDPYNLKKIMKPLLSDVYINVIKEVVDLQGEIAEYEQYKYDIEESYIREFTSFFIDLIYLYQSKEEIENGVSLNISEKIRNLVPEDDYVSLTMIGPQYEMILFLIYDAIIYKTEEFSKRTDLTFDFEDTLEGTIKAIFKALLIKGFKEEVIATKEEKVDYSKTKGSETKDLIGMQFMDIAEEVKTLKAFAKERIQLELKTKVENIMTVELMDKYSEEIILAAKEAINASKGDMLDYREEIKLNLLDQIGNLEIIDSLFKEKIVSVLMDVIKNVSTAEKNSWEKMSARREDLVERYVSPNLRQKTISQIRQVDQKQVILKNDLDKFNSLLEEVVEFTGERLTEDSPLGKFILGIDKLGFREIK